MYRLLLAVSLIGILAFAFIDTSITHQPGILVSEAPRQEVVQAGLLFMHKDYLIEPLATFDAQARVLSKKRYRMGRESDLSPMDLALGWGAMSDENVLKHFSISQSSRWYWWRYKTLPITKKEVIYSSANMHMVPADDLVKRQLMRIQEGHIVHIKGYLIEARAEDGWRWRSSLSRTDSGDHACELVWVEDIEIIQL